MKNFNFSQDLKREMFEMENMFKSSLNSWWTDIEDYTFTLTDDYLWQSICEFVLLAYKYFGVDRDLTIKMGVIFKMAYLANHIHAKVKDDEENQEYNQQLQFTILIGDYLFGSIMKLLLEAEGGDVVDSFAHMMAEISEGFVIKHKIDTNANEVIEKTVASYYSTTFITAARLAGIKQESELQKIEELGLNLGIVMYLIYIGEDYNKINPYIIRVNKLFDLINLHVKVSNSYLEGAIREISEFLGNIKVAVI